LIKRGWGRFAMGSPLPEKVKKEEIGKKG